MLGQATGQVIDPTRLRRVFRLRQLTRTVHRHGQIRLHNVGLYVEQGLWGQTVEVVLYDDVVRIEQAAQQVVSYPCVDDTRQRRITEVDASGRQQYVQVPVIQLVVFTLALVRTVWGMPLYHRTQESRRVLSATPMSLLL
jgi:hypothetical protein